jgi:hypothetical protein
MSAFFARFAYTTNHAPLSEQGNAELKQPRVMIRGVTKNKNEHAVDEKLDAIVLPRFLIKELARAVMV